MTVNPDNSVTFMFVTQYFPALGSRRNRDATG